MSQIRVARHRTSPQVVGLGALNTDRIYRVERIIGDAETAAGKSSIPEYGEAERKFLGAFPGGSAANTVYGLAKLGVATGFIGAIGDDAAGRLALQDLEKATVDTSRIRIKPKAKTGLATCLTDKLNFRSIRVTPGANNRLTTKDIDLEYLNQAEMLHISSFAGERQFQITLKLINRLSPSVKVSFSPGALYVARGFQTLAPILAKTNVLFINDSEIRQLTGIRDFDTAARRCLDLGCKIVVVTLGKGIQRKKTIITSYIRDSKREYPIETTPLEVMEIFVPTEVDTIGAGDAYAAGFLYGLLNGKPLDECGRLGDIVARFSIRAIGARKGLPTLKELSQRYRQLCRRPL